MIRYVNVDITVNTACNMTCSYCTSKDNAVLAYPLEPIMKDIETIHRRIPNWTINFVLLGGEVTILPSGHLSKLVHWLKSRPYCGSLHIFTNAKIWSPELHDLLKQYPEIQIRASYDTFLPSIDMRGITTEEFLGNLLKYEHPNIGIDSTMYNLTIHHYRELQELFIPYGINVFKLKFERMVGQFINYVRKSEQKMIDELQSQIHPDSYFLDNHILWTCGMEIVSDSLVLCFHSDVPNGMYRRAVVSQVQIPEDRLVSTYETIDGQVLRPKHNKM